MKKTAILATVLALSTMTAIAQSHETTTTDAAGNRVVVEISDEPSTKGDTLSTTTYKGQGSVADSDADADENFNVSISKEELQELHDILDDLPVGGLTGLYGVSISIIFLILVSVLLPIVCVITVFVYEHKKRMAKYRMAEKILESGQPLPREFYDGKYSDNSYSSLYDRGVKNVCIGTALFFFLWFICESIGVGCIGLFVVANGVSQLLAAKSHKKYAAITGQDNMHTPDNAKTEPEQESKTEQSTSDAPSVPSTTPDAEPDHTEA